MDMDIPRSTLTAFAVFSMPWCFNLAYINTRGFQKVHGQNGMKRCLFCHIKTVFEIHA